MFGTPSHGYKSNTKSSTRAVTLSTILSGVLKTSEGELRASQNLKKSILPKFQSLLNSKNTTTPSKAQKPQIENLQIENFVTFEDDETQENQSICPTYLKFDILKENLGTLTAKNYSKSQQRRQKFKSTRYETEDVVLFKDNKKDTIQVSPKQLQREKFRNLCQSVDMTRTRPQKSQIEQPIRLQDPSNLSILSQDFSGPRSIKKAVKHLDFLVDVSKEQQRHQTDTKNTFLEAVDNFRIPLNLPNLNVCCDPCSLFRQSVSEMHNFKSEAYNQNYQQRHEVIMEMIRDQKDHQFLKQLQKATPEVRQHINQMLPPVKDPQEVQNLQRSESPMAELIRNEKQAKKKGKKKTSPSRWCESPKVRVQIFRETPNFEIRKFGKSVQKFREIVAERFLTISLNDLEKMHYQEMPTGMLILMGTLKACLDLMLTKPYTNKRYENIGEMYFQLDKNLYENKFLQNLLADIPAFKSQLNLKKTKNLESVLTNQLVAEKQAKQMVLDDVRQVEKRGGFTLNQLFLSQGDKNKFYTNGKNRNYKLKDEKNEEIMAMKQYYKSCEQNQIVVKPHFVQFEHNTMYLSQQNIDLIHGKALQKFLISTRNLSHRRIYRLIIDECNMSDEVFALLLEGAYQQCDFDNHGEIQIQYLTTISYSNNKFGAASLAILTKLIPRMINISLNNLPKLTMDLAKNCVSRLSTNSNLLMKLRLSNINLNCPSIVSDICSIISKAKILQLINLSWCQLSCESLAMICQVLPDRLFSLRSLDFSYNRLNFDDQEYHQSSTNFVNYLCNFLGQSILLNHLKIQGMGFSKHALMQVAEGAASCPLLMSVHLSDNGANGDYVLLNEVLNLFNLGESDLHEVNRAESFKALPNAGYSLKKEVDYVTKVKSNLGLDIETKDIQKQRKNIKDYLIMGKQNKIIETVKAINTQQFNEGLGRLQDNQFDQLVFTRIVNYPELMYNQRILNDANEKTRFFQKDGGYKWNLSKGNDCILCDKHKYTLIFYERGPNAKNSGLTEITDEVFLSEIRNDYYKNYKTYKTPTPLISGSVVKRPNGYPQFSRKLKMVRASLFTLMCISGSALFITEKKQTQTTKQAAVRFLELDKDGLLDKLQIEETLKGWETILDDKCNKNELTDVMQVNSPNFEKNVSKKDIFIFAAFLPPGSHQVLIFDPQCRKAFVKDFVVGINQKDFYPEYPILQDPIKHTKIVQNMWRQWREDTDDDKNRSFNHDIHAETFTPSTFIKQQDDLNECLAIMRHNFDLIKIYQRELIVRSDKYPQASWEKIWGALEWVHLNTNIPKSQQLFQGQVELQFISATKFDETKGLRSAMQRQELIEFIMRLAKAWTANQYNSKTRCSLNLEKFLSLYIKPVVDNSTIIPLRSTIRKSARLNELLFDNIMPLQQLFNEAKLPKAGFTRDAAQQFFMQFPEVSAKLDSEKLEECFIFSMMTVLNEQASLRKYEYLVFVEFLDMLCRVAHAISQYKDTIDYKVYSFLEIIFQHKYDEGSWTEETHELFEINLDVDIND